LFDYISWKGLEGTAEFQDYAEENGFLDCDNNQNGDYDVLMAKIQQLGNTNCPN